MVFRKMMWHRPHLHWITWIKYSVTRRLPSTQVRGRPLFLFKIIIMRSKECSNIETEYQLALCQNKMCGVNCSCLFIDCVFVFVCFLALWSTNASLRPASAVRSRMGRRPTTTTTAADGTARWSRKTTSRPTTTTTATRRWRRRWSWW